MANLLSKVDLVLVDREDTLRLAQSAFSEQATKFRHLSPFDTRLELGKSQTRKESILYYQLDFEQGIEDQALYQVLHSFLKTRIRSWSLEHLLLVRSK